MEKEQKLLVSAIKNGTVIDHIPAYSLFKVIKILELHKIENQITFGTNLSSGKQGKKAIIKISDKFFAEDELNKIGLITNEAKLNIIKDYKVVEKKDVRVPDEVVGIARCVNPKCITNNENIPTKFTVIDKELITLKCNYCEKNTNHGYIKIIR